MIFSSAFPKIGFPHRGTTFKGSFKIFRILDEPVNAYGDTMTEEVAETEEAKGRCGPVPD